MTPGNWRDSGQQINGIQTGNTFLTEQPSLRGGMGLVAIARRFKDGRRYALKTPKNWPGCRADELKAILLFKHEALVWITLGKYRHVVQAHWFDLDANYRPFLIMEYVTGVPAGTSLREVLTSRKRLEVGEALRWTLEALLGLRYAKERLSRERPFIHRDIKPDNLLLTAAGSLKVTDFGLVGGSGGTAPYMPPEQWEGKAVEEKSDVYALAGVLYEMLAGVPYGPFGSLPSHQAYQKAHFEEQPAELPEAPAPVNRLLQRCLAKAAAARPGFEVLQRELLALGETCGVTPFQTSLAPEPLSAEDQNARGSAFHQLGRYRQALECFADAIDLDPEDPRFYLNRGNAASGLGELDTAVRDYHQSLHLNPDSWQARLRLGAVSLQQRRISEAEDFLQEGRRRFPGHPAFLVALGNFYGGQRHFSRAQECFRQALSLDPYLAEAYFGLGNICWLQDELIQAAENYQIALQLNPLEVKGYEYLARLHHLLERHRERDRNLEMVALLKGEGSASGEAG